MTELNRAKMEPHWTDQWMHWTADAEDVQKLRDLSDKATDPRIGIDHTEFKWVMKFVGEQYDLQKLEHEAGSTMH